MNCQDIANLMDERDIGSLTASERAGVAAHLATCVDCSGDWRAFERVLAREQLDMPADFPRRLWHSLGSAIPGSVEPRRGMRPYLLGGLLLVGTAVALVISQSGSEPEPGSIVSVPESSAENAAAAQTTSPSPAQGGAALTGPADPGAASESSLRRVVVLPTVYENPGQVAFESVNAIRPAMLKVLRTLPNLEVVEIVPAQIEAAGFEFPARRASFRDHEIAAHFGGDLSLRFTNDTLGGLLSVSDHWTISITWKHADGTVGSAIEPVPIIDREAVAESRGDRLARTLYGELFPQAARAVWEMVVVDVAQPESRRLEALSNAQAQSGPETAPGLADATVASAIDLARTSADPATRSRIWQILGDYVYPAAREPIIDALLYDPEANVRRTAARALYPYLPDPAVSAALAGASVNDASDSVRLRARWSLMSASERTAFVDATLRNPGLSDEQKMAPLRLLRQNYDDPLDPASLRMLDEIAVRSADPAVRRTALVELGRSADPASLDALIDALHNDPDPSVRESALSAMQTHRRGASPNDGRVYIDALLDVARSDADLSFRTSMLVWLSRDMDAPGVREALEAVLVVNRGNQLGAAIEEALGATSRRNQ